MHKRTLFSCFFLFSFVFANSIAFAQDAKIGYIEYRPSAVPALLDSLTTYFPVNTFEKVTLSNTIGANGLDAVVNEMEAAVNDMTSRGIDRIMIGASSAETGPFIEGNAGSLGGLHSDVRHPNVVFAADRQGTVSVDNAQNWYRPGIDFVTDKVLGGPVLLPEVVAGTLPKPQFILATDNSPGVDQSNTPFTARAMEAGYEVVNVDLGWNETASTFDSFSALGSAIASAPADSKVGISLSAASSADDSQPYVRWVQMSSLGLADPNVFDPTNENVTYLGLNYAPFLGDFDDPGSITVDINYGPGPAISLFADPAGVNPILVELGYPNERFAAGAYEDETYNGSGIVSAASFAWLATDFKTSLDPRHLMDADGQLVEYYIDDAFIPAGATWDEPQTANLRVNPRWTQLSVPEPTSSALAGIAAIGLLALRCRRAHQ